MNISEIIALAQKCKSIDEFCDRVKIIAEPEHYIRTTDCRLVTADLFKANPFPDIFLPVRGAVKEEFLKYVTFKSEHQSRKWTLMNGKAYLNIWLFDDDGNFNAEAFTNVNITLPIDPSKITKDKINHFANEMVEKYGFCDVTHGDFKMVCCNDERSIALCAVTNDVVRDDIPAVRFCIMALVEVCNVDDLDIDSILTHGLEPTGVFGDGVKNDEFVNFVNRCIIPKIVM